jgi:hypothetical protein
MKIKMSEYVEPTKLDSWLNVQLICKPEQSGKTFIMIQQIIKDITEPIIGKEIINIIFCDQSLLLVKQTSARFQTDLFNYYTDSEKNVYLELSSSKGADCHNAAEVLKEIISNNIKNIICCTNATRMNNVYELIDILNNGSHLMHNFHFNIWLDEADKWTKFIDSYLIPIVENNKNVNIKLITATADPLFKKYKYLNVFPIENTTSEEYHGWSDNTIQIINENGEDYLQYIEFILTTVCPEGIKSGAKWFIPALNKKNTHIAVNRLCTTKGIAVICVNGDGILLTMPNFNTYKYEKTEELKVTINKIYKKYKLYDYPLVITGHICVSRGISIISESFMFDYGILSHYNNKNEASQLAGRLKGNIKLFPNYKPTIIFTTNDFNKIAYEWEQKSRNLARLSFEKMKESGLTIIDKNEFNTCNKTYDYIKHATLFDTFDECKRFLDRADIKSHMNLKKSLSSKEFNIQSPIHRIEGYAVTSKLLKAGQTVENLTKEMRLTLVEANNIVESRCISSTDKGSRYLILPVYQELDTPANKEKYQLRYIKFNK